jgi:hypothetical protein
MYKLAPLTITLLTTLGIFSHEMHIDRATTVAVALPAIVAAAGTVGMAETVISHNFHTHVERASLPKVNSDSARTPLPNVKPSRDDDKYIQSKKLMLIGGGSTAGLWPSV